MRALTVLALVLIAMGVLINTVPMLTFASTTYIHTKYRDALTEGVSLIYYGFVPSSNYTYWRGPPWMVINLTKLSGDNYNVSVGLYNVTEGGSITLATILGSQKIASYTATVNSSSYPLLSVIVPGGGKVHVKTLNVNYTIPSPNPPNVFVIVSEAYPGLPYVSMVRETQSILNSNAQIISLNSYYVRFDGQYVMSAFQVISPSSANSMSAFIQSIIPNYQLKYIRPEIYLVLAAGNDLPAQNWAGWFLYGFGFVFPLNVVLIVAGIIVAIYQYRKV